jgi:molybdopterin synthase sulfur carrier subunit
MVTVEFLGPIGVGDLSLDVATLQELSGELKKIPELSSWLDSSAVAVNDQIVSDKSLKLESGDRVSLLPPVCGG